MSDDIRKGQSSSDTHEDNSASQASGANLSRRTFAKAGLIAAPVVMTLASRPALASSKNFCTISGWGSVHPSGRPDGYTCEGRSPGYWKTYWSSDTAASWACAGFDPGPTNPLSSMKHQASHDYFVPTVGELQAAADDPDDSFSQADMDAYILQLGSAATLDTLMGTAPGTWSPALVTGPLPISYPTVMMIFHDNNYKQGLSPGNAAFHYAASLLNAACWESDFGYSLSEMRALISSSHGTTEFVESLNWLHHHGYDSVSGVSNPHNP